MSSAIVAEKEQPVVQPSLQNFVLANTYIIEHKIGSGAFGEIYAGSVINSKTKVAVKVEMTKPKHEQLGHEAKIYKHLGSGNGIPTLYYYGSEGNMNFLVMELLGPSLEALFNYCNRKFTLKTVLMLADGMIQRIEYLHCKHYVHRDIKPDNFVMGLGQNASRVYLIDYGLAHRYRDPISQRHIPFVSNKNLTGTARYAAINTHQGAEQSRRDDLESLGYMLIYFLKGHLPWQGLKASCRETKYRLIMEKKISTTVDALCKGLPIEFSHYLGYVRNLRFDERPDYTHLRRLFKNAMIKNQCIDDKVYDWMLVEGIPENLLNENSTAELNNFNSPGQLVTSNNINNNNNSYSPFGIDEDNIFCTASTPATLSPFQCNEFNIPRNDSFPINSNESSASIQPTKNRTFLSSSAFKAFKREI